MNDKAFTVRDLCERWHISDRVIYELLHKGALKGFRVGTGKQGAWRITPGEVARYEARAA